MRSTESVSIHTLHVLEEESLKRRFSELHMTVPTATALYVLNKKREDLHKIEAAYNVRIFLETDDSLLFPTDYRMERVVRERMTTQDAEIVTPQKSAAIQSYQDELARRSKQRNVPTFIVSANCAFMAGMYIAVPFSSATPIVALYVVAFCFASALWTMIPLGTYILSP